MCVNINIYVYFFIVIERCVYVPVRFPKGVLNCVSHPLETSSGFLFCIISPLPLLFHIQSLTHPHSRKTPAMPWTSFWCRLCSFFCFLALLTVYTEAANNDQQQQQRHHVSHYDYWLMATRCDCDVGVCVRARLFVCESGLVAGGGTIFDVLPDCGGQQQQYARMEDGERELFLLCASLSKVTFTGYASDLLMKRFVQKRVPAEGKAKTKKRQDGQRRNINQQSDHYVRRGIFILVSKVLKIFMGGCTM